MNLVHTNRLRAERKRQGLSYEKMAEKLGYKSKCTYMYIENGKTKPKLEIMLKISEILGKPVDYFYNLELQGKKNTRKTDQSNHGC